MYFFFHLLFIRRSIPTIKSKISGNNKDRDENIPEITQQNT